MASCCFHEVELSIWILIFSAYLQFFSPLPSVTMKASALLAVPSSGSGEHGEASAPDASKEPTPRRSPRKVHGVAAGMRKVQNLMTHSL